MVGYLSKFVGAINKPYYQKQSSNTPLINELTATLSNYFYAQTQLNKKKALMKWFKQIPELTALATKVARDVVYKYHFENANPNEVGRNKILRANKFNQEVAYRKTLLSQMIDNLALGESFAWKGKIPEETVKKEIQNALLYRSPLRNEKKELFERIFSEVKATEGFADLQGIDEDLLRPRKLRYVPSSTTEIIFDEIDIKNYVQTVGLTKVEFSPKEIIHITLMDVDGKVNGFTAIESAVVQLELLRQMWQNMLSLHRNGGSPDKIFVLEDTKPDSPAYERMKDQLKKYKLAENKHGNLLFTGKVNVQELQQLDKMQFTDMGLYITGLMAMMWQIPRSSIPYILGGTNTKDDTGGNSEKGYWRNVEFCQLIIAETYNTQLWMPHFGVKMVFDNTHIQQDVQLQTADGLKYSNIQNIDNILRANNLQLKDSKKLQMLGLTIADIEEAKQDQFLTDTNDGGFVGTDKQPSNSDLQTQDKRNASNRKKVEQSNTIASTGSKPTGVGKEKQWDNVAEIEYKQIIGTDSTDVPLEMFIKLYNEDKAYHPGKPPRIFMRQNDMFTTFIFKSSDFTYRSIVNNEQVTNMSMFRLGAEIYRL